MVVKDITEGVVLDDKSEKPQLDFSKVEGKIVGFNLKFRSCDKKRWNLEEITFFEALPSFSSDDMPKSYQDLHDYLRRCVEADRKGNDYYIKNENYSFEPDRVAEAALQRESYLSMMLLLQEHYLS